MEEIITIENLSEEICILNMKDKESRNSFSEEFINAALEKLSEIKSNKTCKAVILKGLDDIFCSGAAKSELMKLCKGEMSVKDLVLSEMLLDLPVPVIAAMEGGAIGGGFVVGLCADIVIMSQRSMYGGGFTDLGFTPGMGFTRFLKGLIGEYVANELIFTGSLFKGKTFRERGLVNYVLPKAEVMPKAISLAEIISEKPRKTLEILKYSLSMEKRKLLVEARVHEDFMHQISLSQPGLMDTIKERYSEGLVR
jgi:polyketide biosynthesis enoyl-CoA hydratase PksI